METALTIIGVILFVAMVIAWLRGRLVCMDLEFQKIVTEAQWKFIEKILKDNTDLERENVALRSRLADILDETELFLNN